MSTPQVVYLPRYSIQKSQYVCRIVLILVLWTSFRFRFHTLVIGCFRGSAESCGRGKKKIGWSAFAPLVPFFSRSKISLSRSIGYIQTIRRSGWWGPFFGGGSRSTEAAASIPLSAYLRALRAYERNSLAPPLSSDATAILFPIPRIRHTENLSGLSRFRSERVSCAQLFTEIAADYSRFRIFCLSYGITYGTFSWKDFS